MQNFTRWYTNIFVSDFDASLRFFRDLLGMEVVNMDENFGYASFKTGGAGLAFARVDMSEQGSLVGRHTGVGLAVKDINAAYEEMKAAGVEFDQAPKKQPWGGVLALFRDPDGNVFYLDQLS